MAPDPRQIRAQRFPLHAAVEGGDIVRVRQMLEQENRSQLSRKYENSGQTPLHIAASNGPVNMVGILLQAGAGLEEPDAAGQTPLHYAVSNRRPEILQMLVKAGCEVNPRRLKDGWTPLFLATIFGYVMKVRFLVEAGADVLLADELGWTPEDWAVKYRMVQVQRILRSAPRVITESSGKKYVELVKEGRLEVPVEFDEGINRLFAKIEIKRRAKLEAEQKKRALKLEMEVRVESEVEKKVEELQVESEENGENPDAVKSSMGIDKELEIHTENLVLRNNEQESDKELEETTVNILERQKRLVSKEAADETMICPNIENKEQEQKSSEDSDKSSSNVNDNVKTICDTEPDPSNSTLTLEECSVVDKEEIDTKEREHITEINNNYEELTIFNKRDQCDMVSEESEWSPTKETFSQLFLNISEHEVRKVEDQKEASDSNGGDCVKGKISEDSNPVDTNTFLEEWSKEEDDAGNKIAMEIDTEMKPGETHSVVSMNVDLMDCEDEKTNLDCEEENMEKNGYDNISRDPSSIESKKKPVDTLLESRIEGTHLTKDITETGIEIGKAKPIIKNICAFAQKITNGKEGPECAQVPDNNIMTSSTDPTQTESESESNAFKALESAEPSVSSLSLLVLASNLPEVVEDSEFANKVKVFNNYRNFGAMYSEKDNFKKAEWAFKNGIKQATSQKARSKEQLRSFLEAEVEFRVSRARSLFLMGRNKEGNEECEMVLKIDPANPLVPEMIQSCN